MEKNIGPVNSIVLSRAGESDNVYLRDEQSVTENGLCEIKIIDNQIMNFNNRSDFLQGLLNALDGIEYYLNDFSSIGILYYDVGDYYNISIGENIYKCLMLNAEINVENGIEENIHTDLPEQSETDYEKADKTDRRINQTYLIVDKQNQIIEGVVSQVDEQNEQIAQIRLDYNELLSRISSIADITTSGESSYGTVNLVEVNTSQPIDIKIHPITESISYLYPFNLLYPSDNLYMKNRILRFSNTETNENFDWELPTDLWFYDSETYDELELSYGDGENAIVTVIRRCQIDSSGVITPLATETTETYSYPTDLVLSDGDYTVTLLGYSTAYLYVQLMAKNIYTTQFYTKAETNSIISQTSSSIDLSVNQKLSNYSTTNEMNSAINIKANEITSTVSNTYETKSNAQTKYSQLQQSDTQILSTVSSTYETKSNASSKYSQLQQTDSQISSTVATKVGKNEVISKINQSSEAVTINANKIGLTANNVLNILSENTINLTSKEIAIASNNFNVDKNGNMRCSNADVTGTITSSNATITGGKIKVKGTNSMDDLLRVENNSDSSKFSYIQPIGAGFVNGGSDNAIYMVAGGSGDNSIIWLQDNYGYSSISGRRVVTPYVEQTSLETEKKNFEKLEDALNIIRNIEIYKYNLKTENDNTKKHIGFVIGENYKYSKEITSNENTGVDIYSFVSVCCQAIQEQQNQIEELKKEINKLKEG